MKYLVRNDDGKEQKYETRDDLVLAYNQRFLSAGWAARSEDEQEWTTVGHILNPAAPVVDTPESRARQDASTSLWILFALPLVFISGIPVGFLMEDSKPGWLTAAKLLLVFGWFSSTSVFGLYKGIRAARFGIRKGIIGAVINGLIVLALFVLVVDVFFNG
jgi:hypothetical protein